jgi:GntR family transcriptional regulator
MTLDPDAPEPLYEQLAAILRDQIRRGKIKSRQKLPSQSTMEAEYKVSRGTLTAALSLLAEEGTVQFVRGKGYFAK